MSGSAYQDNDEELLALLDANVTAFLKQRHDRGRLRHPREAADNSLWISMAEFGLLAQSLPESDGGAGLGPAAITRVARILGEHLVPEPYVASGVMPATLATRLPAGDVRARIADALSNGKARLTAAWQEEPGQMAAWPVRSVLDKSDRLTGEKLFVVGPSDLALVTAQREGKPILALVDLAQPAVTAESTISGAGFSYAHIRFAGAEIIGDAPLLEGCAAVEAVNEAIEVGRLAAAAQLTGLIRLALALTLEHLKTRVQFGKPIGAFQALQHRAVDMRISLALAEGSVTAAQQALIQHGLNTAALAAISAAKARASSVALSVCEEAIQLHGALGFTDEADIGLCARLALSLSSWLGGAREHRRRFAALEEEFRDAR